MILTYHEFIMTYKTLGFYHNGNIYEEAVLYFKRLTRHKGSFKYYVTQSAYYGRFC